MGILQRPFALSGRACVSALATSTSMPSSAPVTAATPTSNLRCENLARGTPIESLKTSDWTIAASFSWESSKLHSPLTKAPTSAALSLPSPSLSYLEKIASCFLAASSASSFLSWASFWSCACLLHAMTLPTRMAVSLSAAFTLLRRLAASVRVSSVVPWSCRNFPVMKLLHCATTILPAAETASNCEAASRISSGVLSFFSSIPTSAAFSFASSARLSAMRMNCSSSFCRLFASASASSCRLLSSSSFLRFISSLCLCCSCSRNSRSMRCTSCCCCWRIRSPSACFCSKSCCIAVNSW
mmetsp:Transcript_4864/g.13644  ORF Transcript_4864/g.13644 Transcript_4864/m.13644 type:complete len:299 (-) Transcript_4864:950-1846(-)